MHIHNRRFQTCSRLVVIDSVSIYVTTTSERGDISAPSYMLMLAVAQLCDCRIIRPTIGEAHSVVSLLELFQCAAIVSKESNFTFLVDLEGVLVIRHN